MIEETKNNVNLKKYIINVVIMLVVAGLSILYLTKSDVITIESIKSIKVIHVIIVFLLAIVGALLCAVICYFTYKRTINGYSFWHTIGDVFSGNLGSKITPFRLGHFPLRAYYQNKNGLEPYQSLSTLTKAQIVYSIASVLVYGVAFIVVLIMGLKGVVEGIEFPFWIMYLIGFLFHLGSVALCIILAFFEGLQNFVLNIVGKILVKIKKVSNAYEYVDKQKVKMQIYKEQVIDMVKHVGYYLPLLFLYFLQMVITCALPYVAYLLVSGGAFNIESLLYFYLLFITTNYINNVIPLPNGSGSVEIIFTLVYSLAISDAYLGATLICWRLATFYLMIVIEFIIFMMGTCKKSSKKLNNVQT